MLINFDVKSLEIVAAAHLSKDPVMMQEIMDKIDIHEANRLRYNFPLEGGRHLAKIFIFRLIYGGSAYAYKMDPDFNWLSKQEKFWQNIIDTTYAKYYGLAEWHNQIIQTVTRTGRLVIPSGAYFPFTPEKERWPITKIKNYPVQGYGADLVMLARLEAARLFREMGVKALLVSTVHDSIVADAPSDELDVVARLLKQAVETVPRLAKELWNDDFTLPLTGECQYGPNKRDMVEYKY